MHASTIGVVCCTTNRVATTDAPKQRHAAVAANAARAAARCRSSDGAEAVVEDVVVCTSGIC
jgi:hypothetical protein